MALRSGLGIEIEKSLSERADSMLAMRDNALTILCPQTGACLGIAVPAYFVPPVVKRWPMFLPYYTGCCNFTHLLILLLMFRAVKGKPTIHAKKEQPKEIQKEEAVV